MSGKWHLEFELHNEQIHDQLDKCRKKCSLTSMLNKVELNYSLSLIVYVVRF